MTAKRGWAIAVGASLLLLAFLPGCPTPVFRTWFKDIGGEADEGAYAVAPTRDGGFVVAGFAERTHEEDDNALLMKVGPAGRVLWQVEFGDDREDHATAVAQTADGGYIVAGQFGSNTDPDSDAFLVKTDSRGREVWRRLFDSGGHDTAVSVEQTPDGGYLVGLQLDLLGEARATMAKTAPDGSTLWQVDAGVATHPVRAFATADGGYVLAWWEIDFFPAGDEGPSGAVGLLKTGPDGSETWRQIHRDVPIEVKDLRGTPDGGFVLVGQYDLLGADSQILVWKADANGDIEWKQTFGRGVRDIAHAVRNTPDGGFIVLGAMQPERQHSDIYLAKLDADGNVRWERAFGGDDLDEGYDVLVLNKGYLIVGLGESFEAEGQLDHRQAVVARLDAQGHCRTNEVPLPEPPGVAPEHYEMLSFTAGSHQLTPDPLDPDKYEVALIDVDENVSVHRVLAPPPAPEIIYLDARDRRDVPGVSGPRYSSKDFGGTLFSLQDLLGAWGDFGYDHNSPEGALLMGYDRKDAELLFLRLDNPRYDAAAGRLLFEATRLERPTAPELVLLEDSEFSFPTKASSGACLFLAEANSFIPVTVATFTEEVIDSNVPVVLFFTADWSGPCQSMNNVLLEVAAETAGVKFCSVDIDTNMTLCEDYGIRAIPTLLVFNNHALVDRLSGVMPKSAVEAFINHCLR